MGRKSPRGIEGTALSYRDLDDRNRATIAQVRARDEAGAWQVRRFKVVSWKRDGTPVLPDDAMTWARETRKSFIRQETVAVRATFQDFAELLIENLAAAGVGQGRQDLIRAVAKGMEGAGVTDMRSDAFATRVRTWLTNLKTGWSFPTGAKNAPKNRTPLSPATRNKLLVICRQVTQLAVIRRRLAFDPLIEIPRFIESSTIKPVFPIGELRRMVSDESRDHVSLSCAKLKAEIEAVDGPREHAIKSIAKSRNCHWSSIYNELKRSNGPDPWWIACVLLVYTGCRADEAMHLRWEWIDWDSGLITLRLAEDYNNKTDSERMIPLEPELNEILHPLKRSNGHIVSPEVRAGGSGMRMRKLSAEGKGSKDYTAALRKYLLRIGVSAKNRTAHSLRHTFISVKLARSDMNVERLRKAVGHADFSTTMGYGKFSQLFEGEVDRWPDSSLWLRRRISNYAKEVRGLTERIVPANISLMMFSQS